MTTTLVHAVSVAVPPGALLRMTAVMLAYGLVCGVAGAVAYIAWRG
ncbi:hypothetical protein [Actinomadura terrae]|nr:hypothetical protein [Actinomadura terrae]